MLRWRGGGFVGGLCGGGGASRDALRLRDPPLHEFLPHGREEVAALAKVMDLSAAELQRLVDSLVEANPMLGHRGCRLGITYPEITEMQARAIFEAACRVGARGKKVVAEVMIPLVAHVEELRRQAEIIRRVAQEVFLAEERGVPFLVGTMIELPRAALTADEIAKEADFFSFGTNDLTQTTFGLSRDDAFRFLPFYVRSEEHTSELQSPCNLVCRLLLEKKKKERLVHGRPGRALSATQSLTPTGGMHAWQE